MILSANHGKLVSERTHDLAIVVSSGTCPIF
jgi:hypothetical protein